ncbi:Fatty-acid and retinol-binding protein [Dirofilaria immitis]
MPESTEVLKLNFLESIQHELNMFYSSLNAEEKIQLKKFAKTSASTFSLNDVGFLNDLKNEAAGLFGKLIGLRDIINTKLDTMQPESRLFIEKLLRRFLAAFSQDGLLNILEALKGFGKEAMDIFDGLSKPIQNDILKAFPVFGSYITSDIARLILRKLAETNLISRTSILTPTVDQNRDDSGKQSTLSPQVIVVEEPEDSDVEATHNTHYGKKKVATTTKYSTVVDEELIQFADTQKNHPFLCLIPRAAVIAHTALN